MVEKGSGRSRGFGFVSFDAPEGAALAIQMMDGYQVGGLNEWSACCCQWDGTATRGPPSLLPCACTQTRHGWSLYTLPASRVGRQNTQVGHKRLKVQHKKTQAIKDVSSPCRTIPMVVVCDREDTRGMNGGAALLRWWWCRR